MRADPGGVPPLEFLREPALVLHRRGTILKANAAARRLFGLTCVGRDLFTLVAPPVDNLRELLRRASGSTMPLPGAVMVPGVDGETRFRADWARLTAADGTRLVLRLHYPQQDQFALLDRRVRQLNAQLRRRMEENLALQQALRENRVLVSELQHRVKNNIQVMLSLISLSARAARTPEVLRLVEAARLRLEAMASTQEAIYRSERVGRVSSGGLLRTVVEGIGGTFGVRDRLRIDVDDVELANEEAHALALIVTELTTNAIKYGLPGADEGRGASATVDVEFRAREEGCVLTISDGGPGLPPAAESQASGLRLVRGLCRQLRGTLEIEPGAGARCIVRFRPAAEERSA